MSNEVGWQPIKGVFSHSIRSFWWGETARQYTRYDDAEEEPGEHVRDVDLANLAGMGQNLRASEDGNGHAQSFAGLC
jgi:hypothetical protein